MSKKTSTSTSQVSIPPEVLERYTEVNKRAEEVASKPFQQYGTTAEAFVAPINEQQLAGISNVNAATGSYAPYFEKAYGSATAGMASAQPGELNIGKYMNPFQQDVINATMLQMGQANEQAQSGALGTAASSGAFGGDRAGIAAANLANQQGLAMGSTLAGLNAQNYNQALAAAQQQQGVTLGATQADLARLMQGGQFYAGLGAQAQQLGLQGAEAQINAGTLQQQTEQAGKTALVNQFMQEQGYPFQVAQFLANIAMGTGALSGSTTTTTQPAPFFSDRRLKEDVKRIGKTDDGLPIYKFKYKGDDTHQTHVGFMADEVEQREPEAVGLHPSGYKTVDYDKATRNSMGGGVMPERAGQGFAGGGLAGPYGSSAGSQVDFGGYVPEAYLPVGELMVADPNVTNAMRQSFAEQLAAAASMGEKLQSMESTWDWAKNKWGSDEERDAAREAEAARGVAYAYGGAAYLKTPSGGLVPNSAKTYLSDTLESQSKGDKPELKTAEAGGGSGKSPAENIADLGKMAMMFLGMNGGGRVGYQFGGTPEEERMRRLREMEPGAATGLLPSGRVPSADRISAPVSYEPKGFDFKPIVSMASGTPRAYEYDQATGLVRDSATNQYITNAREAVKPTYGAVYARENKARENAIEDINDQRLVDAQRVAGEARDAEDMFQRAADAAARQGSSQLPSVLFPDLYRRMIDTRAAADAAANAPALGSSVFQPQSEVEIAQQMQERARNATLGQRLYGNEPPSSLETPPPGMTTGEGLSSANMAALMPPQVGTMGERLRANEPPISLSQGLVPAAGTPLDAYEMSPDDRPIPVPTQEPSGGLVPAAGTPFPAVQAGQTVGAPTLSTSAPTGVVPPKGQAAPAGFVSAPEQIAPAPEGISDPFQYSLDFVFKHEGGYTPDDAGAGPTKYGINSRAHPGLDIENLTREQAAEIYKNEYWDPINGDELAARDPQLARAVFDTAVNSGVGRALELLKRSGGDTQEFLRLRADFLNGLIERNPEKYGKYAEGWGRRVMELGGPGLNTSYGEAGVGGYSGQSGGLGRAMLTSDKPYEDRSMVGKMFYNEDGTLNRNAIMATISGIGAMLSSPSQFFLPSLGLGLQGFAGTYAGLEKQAADVGLTRAQERREQVAADRERIFEGQNGRLLINFGDGRPPVDLLAYMENPSAYSTGDPQLDAQILREARIAASGRSQPEGVFASPGVQSIIEREAVNAERNPNAALAQSAPIEAAINASASIARSSIPSILTQADAVSALTSPQAAVRAGALGPLKQNVTNYLNDISQTLTQLLNLPPEQALPIIGDPNGGDAAASAQEILKVAVETGMMNASGIQELQTIMAAQPNVALTAEANSALMAGLLVSGRADMRRADFMRDYKAQPNNPQRTAIDAGQAFQETYGDQILAEKAALKELIHYGSQPMPPEWAAILGDYKTPMQFLMTPGIPAEAKNEFIMKLLPALGVNEMVISALQGPDGVYIGNYFGG